MAFDHGSPGATMTSDPRAPGAPGPTGDAGPTGDPGAPADPGEPVEANHRSPSRPTPGRRVAGVALRIAVTVLVAAACVHLARRLDLLAVGDALLGASLPLAALAAALNIVIVAARARVAHVLLRDLRLVPTARLFRYNLAGYALNNLLPGRAGDLVRLYLLGARESVPVGAALAVAVLERVMEALALLVIGGPLALLVPDLPAWARTSLAALSALGLAGLGLAFALARHGGDTSHASRFIAGLSRVRAPRTFGETLVLSAGIWLIDAVNINLCAAAVGLPMHPVIGPLLVLLALSFALAVPSTPAQLGAFELACVAATEIAGAPREQALAFALVYHAVQIVPVTLAGLPGLRYLAAARAATR